MLRYSIKLSTDIHSEITSNPTPRQESYMALKTCSAIYQLNALLQVDSLPAQSSARRYRKLMSLEYPN